MAEQTRQIAASCLLDTWVSNDWTNGIQVNSLPDMAAIHVKTRNSVYEITVIDGGRHEILVRGGKFLPEWTPARLSGSSLRGSFLKVGGIYAGFNMEIAAGDHIITTSQIQSIELYSERQ